MQKKHGRGPSNVNLVSLFAPLSFVEFHNHSTLLTMQADVLFKNIWSRFVNLPYYFENERIY